MGSAMDNDRFVREPERREITGLSASTWWRREKDGLAPKRRRISANVVAWLESELRDWVRKQAKAAEEMPQPVPLKEAAERRREPVGASP